MSVALRITVVLLVLPVAGQAEIVGLALGYQCPPPDELGGYAMIPFPPDPRPSYEYVTSVSGSTGELSFDIPMTIRRQGEGIGYWRPGFTGEVYYTEGQLEVTLGLPAETGAFILYAKSVAGVTIITATANDGTSVSQESYWAYEPSGYGFYTDGATALTSITMSADYSPFAVGEFSIAAIPEPATLGLLALGVLILGWRR